MTEVVELELDRVIVGDRLRVVDPDYVSALALSMAELGQIQPISVRRHRLSKDSFLVIAGAHRVAAAEEAGLPFIRAIVSEMSDDEARMAEIDENLMRQELNALDRAVFLAERQEVYERLHPETVKGGDRKSSNFNDKIKTQTLRFDNFTEEAAEKTGLSRRTVQDAIKLAKALTPEVRAALAGTDLARNANQLKALIAQPPADHLRLIEVMQERGIVKVLDAFRALNRTGPQPAGEHPREAWIRKMEALWHAASTKRWQDDFLARIGAVRVKGNPAAPRPESDE